MSNLLVITAPSPTASTKNNSNYTNKTNLKYNPRIQSNEMRTCEYKPKHEALSHKNVKLDSYEECVTYSLPSDLYDFDYESDTRKSSLEYDSDSITTSNTNKSASIPIKNNLPTKEGFRFEDSRVLLTNSEPSSLRSSPVCPKFESSSIQPKADSRFNLETDNKISPSLIVPIQNWIHCFLEVRFDLETGQAVDRLYPDFVDLTSEQLKTIAFSAFPDTRVFETGDMMFQFRLRKSKAYSSSPTNCSKQMGLCRPVQPDSEFYTAYVYFRQRKDPRVPRGYYQRSLVLLTSLPPPSTVGLFTHLITACGSKYHDFSFEACPSVVTNGEISTLSSAQVFLEAVIQDLARWPYPTYDTTLEVPLAGNVLKIEMPEHEFHPTLQLLETARLTSDPTETHLLASVPDNHAPGLLLHWWDRLDDLWLLWELVLLGEPIVVMASDPATSSNVVLELLDLIKPIPYCGDFRPYLTVQDPDLKRFVNKANVPNNTIVGVTNPYFLEGFKHWPHRIQVGNRFQQSQSINKGHPNLHSKSKPELASNSFFGALTFKTSSTNNLNSLHNGSSSRMLNRTRNLNGSSNGDRRTVVTNYKSCITKDRNLIHSLTSAMLCGDRKSTLLNNRLRRYFGELTERFLAPLNRYMTTLMPNQPQPTDGNKQLDLGCLKPFRSEDFLKSLNVYGVTSNTNHAEWDKELYKRFLRCNNFATWLMMRTQRCDLELKRLRLERLCKFDVDGWSKFRRHETEVIDLIIQLKTELEALPVKDPITSSRIPAKHRTTNSEPSLHNDLLELSNQHTRSVSASATHNDKLKIQIDKAMLLLPKDLQAILRP